MKKLFLSLVVFIVTATAMHAQNSMVATLSHDDDITMFYGTNALREAMNAAASGDIINLSGGAFQSANITKAIIMRGTGIDDATPTIISGSFSINIDAEDTNRLTIEGIRCTDGITMKGTFNNPYFIKSQFNGSLGYESNSTIINALFANCKITKSFSLYGSSTVQFINSYISGFSNNSENTATASFVNCLIRPEGTGANSVNAYYPSRIRNSILLNSIIWSEIERFMQNDKLPSSTIATNCISIGYNDLFGAQVANTNNRTATFVEIFKEFTGYYNDSHTFELTVEARNNYLGNDNTEVGMHGGFLPYNSTPSYPRITKMNVANKTTADGKLSVEIEVSAAE